MDPLTHSVFAIAAALAVTPERKFRRAAALAGLAAGLLPDADIFLRSAADPLFSLEYHRHFTHSLAFSPVIAGLGALIAVGFRRLCRFPEIPWRPLLLAGWVGGLSHLFCDLWTSYGTRIFWPFASTRAALDWVSIIDPILTVPVVACIALAVRYASRRAAVTALCWVSLYLLFANVQRWRAGRALDEWIASQGITATRTALKPSLGNVIVWRGMVQSGGTFQAVAIRCGLGGTTFSAGPQVPLWTVEQAVHGLGLPPDSAQARDIGRFAHFSDDWIGPRNGDPLVIGDLRYASAPDEALALWGITLTPGNPDTHAGYETFREKSGSSLEHLWRMVQGDMKPVVP